MPRQAGPNDFQVAFRLPRAVIVRAEKLAKHLAAPSAIVPLTTTRTEVLRAALLRGLAVLEEELKK